MATAPRVMFYSHNGVGVGHLRRQSRLAGALRARCPQAEVLQATGSHAAGDFGAPPGVELLRLPSIRMTDRYRTWVPREPGRNIEQVISERAGILCDAVKSFRPDVLVADFMPAGPYGELLGALRELRTQGGRAICGFRDIIDEPAFVRELWNATDVFDVLSEFYESILVYGVPEVVDFEASYGLDRGLAARLQYVGYLGHAGAPREPTGEGLIVACTGGGADGGALLSLFLDAAAAERSPIARGRRIVVGGPLLSDAETRALQDQARGSAVEVVRFVADLGGLIRNSELVVTMPGYNTVCELISGAARAVVVPRTGPSREQRLRAAMLERWGRVGVAEPDGLTPERLAEAIARCLSAPAPAPVPVPLDGVERALDLITGVPVSGGARVAEGTT